MSKVTRADATFIGLSAVLWLCACSPQYVSTSARGFGELSAYGRAVPESLSHRRPAGSESPQYLYQYGGDAAARQAEFTPASYVSGGSSPSYADPRSWSTPAAFHTSWHGRDGADALISRASLQPAPFSAPMLGSDLAEGRIPADGEYRLNMPLSSALIMCRSAMIRAGWERHPEYDVFRRGPAQVALRLTPVGSNTAMAVKSGVSLVSDEAWQAAWAKKAASAGSEGKAEGEKEKEKK